MAAGRPSGSITVQEAFVKGAEMEVGPKLWSRSSPTMSPKLPVSPAKVTTTTGRPPAATLISCPKHWARPAPRCTTVTAGSPRTWVYPPAIAVTLPSCRARMPWMSGLSWRASKNGASREPEL